MNCKHTPVMDKARQLLSLLFVSILVFFSGQSRAIPLDLADIPLEVKEGVPPNIILTMDDSGSMAWGFLPDDRDDGNRERTRRFKSSTFNRIYYDPTVTYLPGTDENGTPLPNASFTAAWHNGYNQGLGTVDLSSDYRVIVHDYRGTWNDVQYVDEVGGNLSHNPNDVTAQPAYYYIFDTSKTTGGVACNPTNTAHVMNSDDCYTKVVVSAISGQSRFSPEATNCSPIAQSNSDCWTGPDERQNFANWYSYYRLRHLVAKTATTRAFSRLGTDVRVAWQMLNSDTNIGDPLPFGNTHRTDFFNWIFGARTGGGTPLTDAVWRAGIKFGDSAVYRKDPGDSASPAYSCRQNFSFVFTDGYWNSAGSVTWYNIGNYDDQNHALPTTGASTYGDINYQANTSLSADQTPPIYRDDSSNFLADIAFYFWSRDLSPLDNNVPLFVGDSTTDIDGDGDVDNFDLFWNPLNDPADWQHMVNFTVGLGIDGAIAYNDTSYQQLLNGTFSWGGNHVDDLWHAAINSRGRYLSAQRPHELVEGFSDVINAIVERKGSASSVSTTSSRYEAGTIVFKAIYDPNDWSGEIIAQDILSGSRLWSASEQLGIMLDNNLPRNIITYDPVTAGEGIPFQWSALDSKQQDALNTFNGSTDTYGPNRLAWLRGDRNEELRNGGQFRNRNTYLGDITHSDPVYVPPPYYYYPDSIESVSYSSFVSSYKNRTPMLLAGANDGMLHIFNGDTGRELLAYVPNVLMPRLSLLSDPDYRHEFFIDETVSTWDVFFNGSWHTVAIGGLGKGGQGIYALDITNPSGFTESNAANIALWEFTDADDPDLGYTFIRPYIMKMNNGKWMVGFGNGHNSTELDGTNVSTTGNAILFLVDVENGGKTTGGLKVKLDTETGTAQDPLGQGRPNALSDIVALDTNNDFMVDYIYAGDYFGNLWKFDVSDSDPTKWDVTRVGTTPTPLFIARDAGNRPQPITVAPAILKHPNKPGYLVYVGTGSYLQNDDPSDNSVQSVYAIWDRFNDPVVTIEREHLLEQQMLGIDNTSFAGTNARATTDNRLLWFRSLSGLPTGSENPRRYLGWYIDLLNDGTAEGERIFEDLYAEGNTLQFTTIIPSLDPCISGGESWYFKINAATGSRFRTTSPWDYNLNGTVGSDDKLTASGTPDYGSGIQLKTKGLFRTHRMRVPNECTDAVIFAGADGSDNAIRGSCSNRQIKRRSWRELEIR